MPTRRTVLVGLAGGLAGCGLFGGPEAVPGEPSPPPATTAAWYPTPAPTGNRTLAGSGDLRTAEPVTFAPDGRPQWLVARPATEGTRWTVATADGRVTDWHVSEGTATRTRSLGEIPPATRPVFRRGPEGTGLLNPPGGMSVQASPVVTPRTDAHPSKLLYVAGNGDLVVAGEATTRLDVDAPPDSRLADVGDGRYALFGDATDRYEHGALGDTTEGETLYVVDARAADIVAEATLDAPVVFEGLQPLVADLDGDGSAEIVTTVADSADGARIAAFSAAGERLATGPVDEPGWRHQLTVAPFGPDGQPELAVVRQPHVERLLEFYRLEDGTLSVVATAEAFASHTYGSRILGGGIAGGFADGDTAVLVPTAERDDIAAVRRDGGGATVAWELELDGPLTSNLTGVTRPPGGVAVGAATATTVHVWQV